MKSKEAIERHIKELLSEMTVEEKLDELDPNIMGIDWEKIEEPMRRECLEKLEKRRADARVYNALQKYAKEQTRLGIPFLFHEEALHGLHRRDATIFPQQLTLAGAFEPALCEDMGRMVAAETRAKNIHEVLAPVLDLARDPRWGRTEETYGEDTYLSSKLGAAVVRGLQGEDLATDHTVASELKHYTGYGNPIGGLNCAPTTMGRHDVFSYCMPVFEEAFVKAGATDTMCSYNSIDGFPVVSDHEILTDVLRGTYKMPGFVRSDMTAIIMQHTAHHSAATPKEALQKAVKAGVDVQFADYSHEEYRRLMKEMLADGSITMEELDTSTARVLRVKDMLGLFENPYVDETLESKVVHCKEHQDKALEIAQKTVVLLKNENNMLPLSRSIRKIAVLGPERKSSGYGRLLYGAGLPCSNTAGGDPGGAGRSGGECRDSCQCLTSGNCLRQGLQYSGCRDQAAGAMVVQCKAASGGGYHGDRLRFYSGVFQRCRFFGRTGSDETRFADQLQLDLPCSG